MQFKSRILFVIILFWMIWANAVTPNEFKQQLAQLNSFFAEAAAAGRSNGGAVPVLEIQLGATISESEVPYFELSKDFKTLTLKISDSYLQDPNKFVVLLSHLGGALEFPIEAISTYSSGKPKPPIYALLRNIRGLTNYNTLLHLIEMTAEDRLNPIVKSRWKLGFLLSYQQAKDIFPYVQDQLKLIFPTAQFDFRVINQNSERASELIRTKYEMKDWETLANFFRGFSSEVIRDAAAKGDREFVAKELEKVLPVKMLTKRELAFWQEQIEAIRRPEHKNLLYLYRGGEFTNGDSKGYTSSSFRSEPRALVNDLESSPSLMLNRVSTLQTLFSHSDETSLNFISTTFEKRIAERFARRSQNLTVVAIDSRRAIPGYVSRFSENEVLIPWIIFPDEIVGTSMEISESELVSKFGGKISNSKLKMKIKNNLQLHLNPRNAVSCKSAHRI